LREKKRKRERENGEREREGERESARSSVKCFQKSIYNNGMMEFEIAWKECPSKMYYRVFICFGNIIIVLLTQKTILLKD
jgi:hypothetical protein